MSSPTDNKPPLNNLQMVLKTVSALMNLAPIPYAGLAAVTLGSLADHEPAIAEAVAGFSNLKHVTLGELIEAENAAIMSADVYKDTEVQ